MDLPIPNPPTDNMYKFMAIFGLIILVLSVALPWWASYQLALAGANVMADAAAETDTAVYQWQQASLYDRPNPDTHPASTSSSTQPHHQLSVDTIRDLTRDLKRTQEASAKRFKGSRKAWRLIGYHRHLLRRSLWVAIPSGLMGLTIMVCGFFLWYTRLQRHLDCNVRSQTDQRA